MRVIYFLFSTSTRLSSYQKNWVLYIMQSLTASPPSITTSAVNQLPQYQSPIPEMRQYLKPDSSICLKKGIAQIFTLKDPDGGFFQPNSKHGNILLTVVYATEEEDIRCSMACIEAGWCTCSKCRLV